MADYCKQKDLRLPGPLGDCTKDQMPLEVQAAIEKLEKELKKTEPGRADLKALEEAAGKWPDYPRLVMDLAKKYKQPLPGWTLPGPAKFWEGLRAGRGKGK